MNKHFNQNYKETYYTKTLDNGMKVIIFHRPGFKQSNFALGFRFGGANNRLKVDNQIYDFHPGVAHFLEHKLFDYKGRDVLLDFTKMGVMANAFTSYDETIYYFTSYNDEFEEALNLLLDFCQDFKISEESVEKEKPIIIQELNGNLQSEMRRLIRETYRSLYFNHPLINDIGGNEESVKLIDKEELERCYKINYHPANSILCISSHIDPHKIMDVILENQSNKHFDEFKNIKHLIDDEPLEVNRKEYIFEMPVSAPRHSLTFKLKPLYQDPYDAFICEKALEIYLASCLSSYNPLNQKWLDEGKRNDFFTFHVDYDTDCASIFLAYEAKDNNLLDLFNEGINNSSLDEDFLRLVKRRIMGGNFYKLESIENFNLDYLSDALNDMDTFKKFDLIKEIDIEKVKDIINNIDLSNYAKVTVKNK